MSRIGKRPIIVPKGVTVTIKDGRIAVKGPKGQLERAIHPAATVTAAPDKLTVAMTNPEKSETRRFFGLTRTLVANMVAGVTEGFSKRLTLVGVGYRAQPAGKGVTLNIGFSHPVEFAPPAGIEVKVDKQTTLIVSGADKELVGQTAATIRSYRPPEPYHGKGVRYEDEVIVTKVGKAGAKK